jgi:hypothetical protein
MPANLKNILPVVFSFLLYISIYSQNKPHEYKVPKDSNQKSLDLKLQDNKDFTRNEQVVNVVKKIQDAIVNKDISTLVDHLSSQTYFNLPNGISGYYSSNQAYFVLEDFLKTYRVTSFNFDEINTKNNTPFATGTYDYDFKGNRNSAHIYLQLRNTGKNWRITQITIN